MEHEWLDNGKRYLLDGLGLYEWGIPPDDAAHFTWLRLTEHERIAPILYRQALRLAARDQEHERLMAELAEALGIDPAWTDLMERGPGVLAVVQELASGVRGKNARLAERAGQIADLEERVAEGRREAEKRIAALEEENARLRADNLSLVNDLEKEGHRVTSLRLEVETLKLQIANKDKAIAALEDVRRSWLEWASIKDREEASLRIDLAAAIKTGEEQAEKIRELEAECASKSGFFRKSEILEARLSRLDALLASEEVPEGLLNAIYQPSNLHLLAEEGEEAAKHAWRWLRDILRDDESSTDRLGRLAAEADAAYQDAMGGYSASEGWMKRALAAEAGKAKILAYLETYARMAQPVLAWHLRKIKADIEANAHLADSVTFSMPPYKVVEEQDRTDAATREALDDIVERKIADAPPFPLISPETEHLMAGRWISPEEAKEHWPDSSEPIRTQPVMEQRDAMGFIVEPDPEGVRENLRRTWEREYDMAPWRGKEAYERLHETEAAEVLAAKNGGRLPVVQGRQEFCPHCKRSLDNRARYSPFNPRREIRLGGPEVASPFYKCPDCAGLWEVHTPSEEPQGE